MDIGSNDYARIRIILAALITQKKMESERTRFLKFLLMISWPTPLKTLKFKVLYEHTSVQVCIVLNMLMTFSNGQSVVDSISGNWSSNQRK